MAVPEDRLESDRPAPRESDAALTALCKKRWPHINLFKP